jgi:hypothetical protein
VNKFWLHIKNQIREYCNYFYNGRVWSLFFLLIILIHIYLTPVINFSIAAKYKVTPWVVIFLFSSVYFDLIFLLGSIYLFSKVPFLERWQMYQQIRYGKTKWGFIQIGKIVLSSFSYVFVIILLSFLALAKNLHYEKGWGKVLYTLALTDAGEIYEEEFPISYQLINDNKVPLCVLGKVILIISLIVMTIGLLMYLISICFSRLVAIIITIMFSIFPIMIEEADIQIQRLLVEVIPTEWIKIYKIGNTYNTVQSPDWNTIIVRLIILNVLLSIFIIYRIHKMEFNWYGEE